MPLGNLLKHLRTEPFPEFHRWLLIAGGTEMTSLTGEGKEIFMVAIPAPNPGKAGAQVATFQVGRSTRSRIAFKKNHHKSKKGFKHRSNPNPAGFLGNK